MMFPDPLPPGAGDPPMLVPLDTLKALLGVPAAVDTWDVQIEFAGQVASALIVDYTGRNLVRATYTEQFQGPQSYSGAWWGGEAAGFYSLTEFPAEGVASITINGLADISRLRKMHRKLALVWLDGIGISDDVVIEYVGGYEPLPASITALVLELVRRQLGSMGVDLGSVGGTGAEAVKAVSIGQLRVEHAVSSSAADMAAGMASPLLGSTLEQFSHVLDMYRHPTRLVAVG